MRNAVRMRVKPTRHGLRFSQHGVVISELRVRPGPTHSVFDVLAALLVVLRPGGRAGLLGFAGGGMLAPLSALEYRGPLHAVDLDRASYDAFCQHCPHWRARVQWTQADAGDWLRRQRGHFDLLLDDLSVPHEGDVVKPDLCWTELPGLIRRRLRPGGAAVFNLLPPAPGGWAAAGARIQRCFATARMIHLDQFENRILVAGELLPSARELSVALRGSLRQIGSRQAGRLRVRSLPRLR